MFFNFELYSSVLLIFFTGIIVCSVVIFREGLLHDQESSFWLGGLLLLVALYIAPFMLGYAGWYSRNGYREVLFYIPFQQLFFIGPFFFIYIKYLLYPAYSLDRKDFLHFIPGSLYLAYSFIIFLVDTLLLEEVYFYRDGRDKDFDLWYQIAGFLWMIAYFLMSMSIYRRYRKEIYDQLSYADEMTHTWVKYFLTVFLIILTLRGLFFVINPEWGEFGRKFWYYLAISMVGSGLGIRGYKQSIISNLSFTVKRKAKFSESRKLPEEVDDMASRNSEWIAKIDHVMKKKQLFKNSLLTLSDVAQELNTHTKIISTAINTETGLNFNDYVNRFRIKAVMQEFRQSAHHHRTILGIAMDCGFNSKSTFNRAFRKYTGQNPNDFLKSGAKS